jgi:anti-anti-sigma regulatory factor
VLDFEGIEYYLNAHFKGQLVSLHKVVERAHGSLKLCNLSPTDRASFRLSGLDGCLCIVPTLSDALAQPSQ